MRWLHSVNEPRLRTQSAGGKKERKKAGRHRRRAVCGGLLCPSSRQIHPGSGEKGGQDVQPEVTDAVLWSPAAEPPSSSPFSSSLGVRIISLFSPDTCKTEGARRVWKPRAVWKLLFPFPFGQITQCHRQLHSECYYHTHNDISAFNSWVKKETFDIENTLRKEKHKWDLSLISQFFFFSK